MKNVSPLLTQYCEKARAAGAEVALVPAESFPLRLAALLSHITSIAREASLLRTGGDSFLAALPASGWPPGLLEIVEPVLGSSGFTSVKPQPAGDLFRGTSKKYTWDRSLVSRAVVGITFCRHYLAGTGTLVLPSGPGAGTLASLLPYVHLALSYPEGCLESLAECLRLMAGALPSRLTLATGPSRTGDIEATYSTGVHGPKHVFHYVLVDTKK